MQIIENKNCSICDALDWKSLDYLRDQTYWYDRNYLLDEPVGFKICKNCGFVTYDYIDDEELKRRYDDLIKIVDVSSMITKNRKIAYHKKFLLDVSMVSGRNFLDYGAATGYFLKWLENKWWGKGYGVESNDIMRRFAKHEYDIELSTEIPDEQFDFISCYHTLEHVQYPDKLLKQFAEQLTDDGYLYISVPQIIQEEILDEASGATAAEFEELYHLNHVNQFSKISLNNILNKCGFEIIKEDDKLYGYTVLCKKKSLVESAGYEILLKENYLEIVSIIEKQKKAMDFFKKEKWEDARKAHKGYPDAWIMNAIKNFKDLPEQERVLKEALEATNNHYKIRKQLAYLYHQWDENKARENFISNHIKLAKRLFEELIEEKPGMEDYLYYLSMIEMKWYKNYEKARGYLDRILEINPAKYSEIINLIGLIWKEKDKPGQHAIDQQEQTKKYWDNYYKEFKNACDKCGKKIDREMAHRFEVGWNDKTKSQNHIFLCDDCQEDYAEMRSDFLMNKDD